MAVRLSRKASLRKSTACPVLPAIRSLEDRPVDTLDKVYTRLMLGEKAVQQASKQLRRDKNARMD